MKGALITLLVVVGVLTLGGCAVASMTLGVYNDGVRLERALNAQYLSNQNDLSAFIAGYREQWGVIDATTTQLLQPFVVDAVKGRYDDKDAAGMPTGTINASLFIKAIAEAYPDTKGVTDMSGKLVIWIQARRQGFQSSQDKLLDMLRRYDTWRSEQPRGFFLNMMGFPSSNLEARVGGEVYQGARAREQMYRIVLTSDATKAFQSGTMEPLTIPTKAPSK